MKSHPLSINGGYRYARLASRREYNRLGMSFSDEASKQAYEIHQLEQDLRAVCNALADAETAPGLTTGADESAWVEYGGLVLRVDYSIDKETGDLVMESALVADADIMGLLPESTLSAIEVLALEAHLANVSEADQ